MSWEERLREAAYVAPSGTRIVFGYRNVSQVLPKKTAAFDFPDADGTFVQDNGASGRRYPIRAIFSGEDCDLSADEFLLALAEKGVGKLEHPLYRTAGNVVPFGEIRRRDDLATAANQSIVEVVFWDTTGAIYPATTSDGAGEVQNALDEYNEASATAFDDALSLDTAIERVTLQNQINGLLDSVEEGLQAVADVNDSVSKAFKDAYDSVDRAVSVLIDQPLTLALQIQQTIQLPSRLTEQMSAKIEAYGNLAEDIFSSSESGTSSSSPTINSNALAANDLFASTHVSGAVSSTIYGEFPNREAALVAADDVLSLMGDLTEWRDAEYNDTEVLDTGETYEALQNAVALAAGFLVSTSFGLRQQRSITLSRDRTIVDLTAELYGSVDDFLDAMINDNDLTGSEIIELPRGRTIVYYV